jgi:hypothetical protein
MIVISARSPYQIIINVANQTSTKVELFIYNKGTAIPTIPTYTMSEPIASVTQTETNYNISSFLLEYINPISMGSGGAVASNTDWCLCRVKTYATVAGTESLQTTTDYVVVNSYTEVADGYNADNFPDDLNWAFLGNNPNIRLKYYVNIPYYNFIGTRATGITYSAKYYNSVGTLLSTNNFITAGATEIINYKVPLAVANSVRCDIERTGDGVIKTIFCEPIEECKYTPVDCTFVNKYGGWQRFVFFKANTFLIDTKGSEYNLMQPQINYNPLSGQRKTFNINGTQSIKLNTGFVEENNAELIKQIMLSETILLDNYPVNVKTKSLTYKTHLKDKNINYEVEFDYANNLINDVL